MNCNFLLPKTLSELEDLLDDNFTYLKNMFNSIKSYFKKIH